MSILQPLFDLVMHGVANAVTRGVQLGLARVAEAAQANQPEPEVLQLAALPAPTDDETPRARRKQ